MTPSHGGVRGEFVAEGHLGSQTVNSVRDARLIDSLVSGVVRYARFGGEPTMLLPWPKTPVRFHR